MSSAAEDEAKMEDRNNNAMEVDALDPGKALEEALRAELKSTGKYNSVEEWWGHLKISHSQNVSGELSQRSTFLARMLGSRTRRPLILRLLLFHQRSSRK